MSRYKLTIEYDGSNYCGWQSQPDGNSVQDKIEVSLMKLFGKKITVYGSGRTDKGVHAYGQAAHCDIDTLMPTHKLITAINAFLPMDIRIKAVEIAADDFHARFDAKSKTYIYKLYISDISSPIRRKYYHQIYGEVDVALMAEACKCFLGKHDFYAFSSKSDKEATVRTLTEVKLERQADEIYITITGDGFLYNMVRVIVSTIIEAGKGKIKISDIPEIFTSRDRTKSGKKISAEGLYLLKVEY